MVLLDLRHPWINYLHSDAGDAGDPRAMGMFFFKSKHEQITRDGMGHEARLEIWEALGIDPGVHGSEPKVSL